MSAVDWFFSKETFGIVLEDDCFPEDGLLEFFSRNFENWSQLKKDRVRLMTGHNPISDTCENYIVSTPLIWAWATDSLTWFQVRKGFFDYDLPRFKNINGEKRKLPEMVYWWSNAMRARLSKVDTWDGIFGYRFWQLGFKTLVPKENLVRNIGFDERATHTKEPALSQFQLILSAKTQESADALLRKHYFKIRTRHSITPLIRILGDLKQGIKSKDFEGTLFQDQQFRKELHFN